MDKFAYTVKQGLEKKDCIPLLEDLGFELLPQEICKVENTDSIWFKIVEQPKDGDCVNLLINFYNNLAEKICADKFARRCHVQMGIKFRKKNEKYHLVVTDALREMFSMWRLEINLDDFEPNIYFTISDGNMPSFYDANLVINKYCKDVISELINGGVAEKVKVEQETKDAHIVQ